MSSSQLADFLSSTIPEFKTPPPPRLQSLFADVSIQKNANQEGYRSTLAWWTRLLQSVVQSGNQPSSDDVLILHASEELPAALRWNKVGRPLGLGLIVQDLTSEGTLVPVTSFISSPASLYYQPGLAYRTASYIIGRPLWWALSQMSLVDGSSSLTDEERWKKAKGDYVVRSLVERAAEAVISHQRSKAQLSLTNNLYSAGSFKEEFGKIAIKGSTLSQEDVKVLLRHLERDRKVIIRDKEVIKFIETEMHHRPQQITETDKGVLEMKITISRLEEQIEEIQNQITERTNKIKDFLRKGQKVMATSYLRSRKQLEEVLGKRLGSLETIQTILLKIENAANDLEIMRAYETSTNTLKTILAKPELQLENVERTLDAMSEALADHKEIDDAIKLGMEDTSGVDEDELEEELKMLEEERRAEIEQEKRLKGQKTERVKPLVEDSEREDAEERQQAKDWEALERKFRAPPSSINTTESRELLEQTAVGQRKEQRGVLEGA
ncbi:hypothetical protein FRC02_009652 [Tulasnella sp. 418]|nr:hypothetical protein FRC02_009652 [Tulasnella sp. 418]